MGDEKIAIVRISDTEVYIIHHIKDDPLHSYIEMVESDDLKYTYNIQIM